MDTLFCYRPVERVASFDRLCEALFGGECPTRDVLGHIIGGTDEAPTYAVIGTAAACRDVIFHLWSERVIPSTMSDVDWWPAAERHHPELAGV